MSDSNASPEIRLGRDPASVSMFEHVSFEHAGRIWSGEVRGIFPAHVKVLRGNGANQRVEYTQLVAQ